MRVYFYRGRDYGKGATGKGHITPAAKPRNPVARVAGQFKKIFKKPRFVRLIGHMVCYYTPRNQTNVYKYTMEGTDMKEREELIRYISNLTEADMKKIIQRLPELISKLEAQGLPVRLLKNTHIE